ncbi:cleavage and polyadenylation specificity factor subunit 1 [Nematocida major]|uniref:cleavage and polyadenylation specificity factor subunit 1 n=1 Tax=Nematocida major TaxID=1912982 RepID=UPI002007A8E2|nr:cleavage and polyadenylation specificity factor subunit 1 [Nematocida major]KAH9385504.1 cleavage and polyadenylation specificity factor subunit 1 [Nematocida major]
MGHLLQERYFGSANQHLAMGEFVKGEVCLFSAGCDRIVLYRVQNGVLVKIKEKRVFGNILGVVSVPSTCEEPDSLLVHFEHARVSSVVFREEQNEFVCKALRFYEKQQYGFVTGPEKNNSFIRVDEEHEFSYLQISNTHFAIFSSSSVGESKVFEMQKVRPRHCAIKDVVFLKGYSSPTLCFLFEDTVAERSRILVYVLNQERELAFFFEVTSVPHGCYMLVPTPDKAFMVLGACGALFYSQWEMLGVRFNDFWSFETLGIQERLLEGRKFMMESGKCLVKEKDIFVFSENIFLRFTILGGNSRIHNVIPTKIELGICYNRPYSTAVHQNYGCVSTAEGMFLVTFEAEIITEKVEQQPADVVTEEYASMFLQDSFGLDENAPAASDGRVQTKYITKSARRAREGTSSAAELSPGLEAGGSGPEEKSYEREYEKMFKMAGEFEKKSEPVSKETVTSRVVISQAIPSLGEVMSIEPISLVDKQCRYLVAAGSPGRPLLVEMREGIDLLYTQTAKIRGYSDLFVVDAQENMYLMTKEGESEVVQWAGDLDLVESEISASKTILFEPTSFGYLQVSTTEIVHLTKSFKKKKKAVLPEQAKAAINIEDVVFVLGAEGGIYQYKGAKRLKVHIEKAVACMALHGDTLFVATGDGSLVEYSIPERRVEREYSLFSVFPSVLEQADLSVNAKHRLAIFEIAAVEHMSVLYLVARTINNEIAIYKKRGEVFFKETASNNAFYYESADKANRKLNRLKVCGDLVFIPGHYRTRVLVFSQYSLSLHWARMPIESIGEISAGRPGPRSFIIMAKGNIAIGTMPDYECDKSILYKKTWVDSICQKVAYSSAKKVAVASVYTEKEYTQSMIPFTVQATTELDAEPVPLPSMPDSSVNPLTRAYSLKIYSLEEIRQYSRSDSVLTAVDEYVLEDNEYVAYHMIASLPDQQNTEGHSEFVIVCTTYITDEDLMARGRLIVLEIASVVPKRERRETRHKLKALAAEKTKGATTACDIIKGNIVVCVGTKLMIYKFDRNEGLMAVAFHDIHVFLTSCMVMRNIIVCGDAYKGTFLLFYQSEPPLLHMLSQSSGTPYLLKGIGMTRYGTSLSLISYDSARTVSIHTYAPQHILSQGGTRLISRGECKLPDEISGSIKVEANGIVRTVLYTKNGYMYSHKVVDQSRYVALLDLQQAVESSHWVSLGTNPKSHWHSNKPAESKEITLKEVLQTGLMEEFYSMCNARANKIASESGRASSGAVKTELGLY